MGVKRLGTKVGALLLAMVMVVALSGSMYAAAWDPDKDVTISITVNEKFDLTITSGGSISATLDPGETVTLNDSTVINVKTNSGSWNVTAQITADTYGFMEEDGAAVEVSSDNGSTWTAIGTGSAVDVTGEKTSRGANNPITFKYRVTTTWTHEAQAYPMTITYTAQHYTT